MAAFDFPSSPSVNQTYTANGVTWKWNGTMWMRVSGAGYLEKIEEGDSKVEVDDSGSGNVTVTTDGAERLRITSDGKIGIGHHSAAQITKELTIRPADDGGIMIGRPGDTVTPINAHLLLTTTTSGSVFPTGEAYTVKYNTRNCDAIFNTFEAGGTGGNISFQTGSGSGNEVERLRITSGGEVNIGGNYTQTNAPLCVTTNANDFGIRLMSGSRTVLDVLNNDAAGNAEIRGYYNNNTGTQGEGFRLEASGNSYFTGGSFGIGTNGPSSRLDVVGGGIACSGWSNNNSGASGGMELGWDGTQVVLQSIDRNGGGGFQPVLLSGSEVRSNSNIKFNNSGNGIDFSAAGNASGMTSELLDDYEEGTFTPTLITNGGTGSVGSYGQRAASYTKIGRQVTCFGRLAITNKGTLSGGLAIGDLPFTIADTVSTTGIDGGGVLNYFSGVNSSHYTDFISANPIQATTYFVIYRGNQVGALSGMDQGHIDNNFDCRFTITYFTAS